MRLLTTILLALLISQTMRGEFRIQAQQELQVAIDPSEAPVVHTALELLSRDYQAVFSAAITRGTAEGKLIIATANHSRVVNSLKIDLSDLTDKKQAFLIKVLPGGKLAIIGSDSHGTAYGIMELSRLIGVSPWEWWADVTPEKREKFVLAKNFYKVQAPVVEYRGIFINDEDWGLMPWSSFTYEPWHKAGRVGPRTNERIFELLLRLRANYYWPAMHECTLPFFLTEGNREVAERFGIYIGGSHCEPMGSSTAGEWPARGKGNYDYVNNREEVYRFWETRVKEVASQEMLYTIGMRGVHDGKMEGAKSIEEQKGVLERAFVDQRQLLAKYVNEEVTAVPQLFIPYKEVLDIYHAGLVVPDDVTLMWCDDNYGYIKHFPTAEERQRKGGNGVYYHVSYWGRPHDYLWLGTFSPFLLYQQMKMAYDYEMRKVWILNVGDIKPAEYQIELFMDMAWDMAQVEKEGVSTHLNRFLSREFGKKTGAALTPLMEEHYRLAFIRKPEFMGNTRVEEADREYYGMVKDLPWSENCLNQRVDDYKTLSDKIEKIAQTILTARKDAFFHLVKYPVQGATEMNKKIIYAQLARHGKMAWQASETAYDSIVSLTQQYNQGFTNGGKWNRIMDYQPRKLPVFEAVTPETATKPMVLDRLPLYKWNGTEASRGNFTPCHGLGYEGKAAAIPKGESLSFTFGKWPTDSLTIEVRLLPNHPIESRQLRFSLTLNGEESNPIHYETRGRSEEWKMNVLRNQAIRTIKLPIERGQRNRLSLKALDQGVVLDQLLLFTH